MSGDPNDDAGWDASFFAGRFLVEIMDWDWGLHVGLSPESVPLEYRFQGGLLYTRSLEINGRVLAPKVHRDKLISIRVSPFGPEIGFAPGQLDEVGQFREYPAGARDRSFDAAVLMPEGSLAMMMTCLTSVWKYVHIWTTEDPLDRASVTDVSFSRDIHPNLRLWIDT